MERSPVAADRLAVVGLLLVAALVVAAVGAVLVGGVGQFTPSPCDDDLADQAPVAEFDVDRDAASRTLSVTHAGGDTLREQWTWSCLRTGRLVVDVDSADPTRGQRVVWVAANGSGVDSLPVGTGDDLTLREPNSTAPGDAPLAGPLTDDTVIRVVWVEKGGETSATLAKYAVGETGG